jgi:thioesterase domain-containing protein
LEGTGSFAAGLAEALAQAGEDVAEVGGLRRAGGEKNDRVDAIRSARTVMANRTRNTSGNLKCWRFAEVADECERNL